MKQITIRSPDDAHFHPRSGPLLRTIIDFTSAIFPRALVKGNLALNGKLDPVYQADQMITWCREIRKASHFPFNPIATIMMIRKTTLEIVKKARENGAAALCLIPEGTSTNSEYGVAVADLSSYFPILEWMQKDGMAFSVHPELNMDPETNQEIPEIDREARFLPFLVELNRLFPDLRIIAEHLSTKEGVDTVSGLSKNVFATLTAHHMILTINDVLNRNGKIINPDNYCKPVAKTENDRLAVINAAISGNPKFMFGSDSAAHWAFDKRKAKPNAGILSVPIALPILAKIFEEKNALDKLEAFTSCHFAQCHGLPLNKGVVTLVKKPWVVPKEYNGVNFFLGDQTMDWQVV